MPSYRVDVAELLEELGSEIAVSGTLELSELRVGDEVFRAIAPAAFDVVVANTGAGLVASGEVRLAVRAECCRCLREFETEIVGAVEGFYVSQDQTDTLPEEQEYELIDDRTVELVPALVAALTVEAPFAPLHDEECAGICPECGADLNEGPCACPPSAEAAGPFGALADLLGSPAEGTPPEGDEPSKDDAGEDGPPR